MTTALLCGCGSSSTPDARTQRNAEGVRATLLAFSRSVHPKDIPGTCRAMVAYVTPDFLELMKPFGGCEAVLGRLHGSGVLVTAKQAVSTRVTVSGSSAKLSIPSRSGPDKGSMIYGSDHRWRIQPTDEAGNPISAKHP